MTDIFLEIISFDKDGKYSRNIKRKNEETKWFVSYNDIYLYIDIDIQRYIYIYSFTEDNYVPAITSNLSAISGACGEKMWSAAPHEDVATV